MEELEIIKPDDWHVHFRDGEVLKALVLNSLKGLLKICVLRSPEFGNSRIDAMSDLAIMFGTKVYSSAEELPKTTEELGSVKKVIVSRYESIFVTKNPDKEQIDSRVQAIKEMQRVGKKHFICTESYRNEKELFNLQCWALTCESFFSKSFSEPSLWFRKRG